MAEAYTSGTFVAGKVRNSADYALCEASEDLSTSDLGAKGFEVIGANSEAGRGDHVLIAGYGCTELSVSNGGVIHGDPDYVLRVADAQITDSPSPLGADYLDVVSTLLQTPAICPGDSGGPLITNASVASQDSPRTIVAVNSGVEPAAEAKTVISVFASLARPEFHSFLASWVFHHPGLEICGVTSPAGADNCRS
jgi:hypothetical protein